ncbi:MAG TPA: S41 family peptidase [Saprospiraceae bacterium]|nr:S41 family peptidase [Saprospiraceae bacterium]
MKALSLNVAKFQPARCICYLSMIWFVSLCLSSLPSCNIFRLEEELADDPESVFEYLWNDVKIKYSYFELKSIDWDSIHLKYRPAIHRNTNALELFDILSEMLFELKDGHVNLTSVFDRSRNWEWFQDYPSNFNINNVERNYLGKDFRITGPFRHTFLDTLLYIYYPSFALTITDSHIDVLHAFARVSKGIILDIRDNGGGNLGNARRLASLFSSNEIEYGMERLKNGPGINDFSEWKKITFPGRGANTYSGPVILLTNRKCFSAATFFTLMMQTLPQVKILGDQTGGGGGIPGFGELPNGWQYRCSVSQTVSLDGIHIESGILPDIRMDLLNEDEVKGIDTYIEKAIELLQ